MYIPTWLSPNRNIDSRRRHWVGRSGHLGPAVLIRIAGAFAKIPWSQFSQLSCTASFGRFALNDAVFLSSATRERLFRCSF